MTGRTLATLLMLAVARTAHTAPFAFITNALDDTVSRLDVASHEAISIPVAPVPGAVAVNPTGTRAYVSHFEAGIVTVIDGETASVLHTIPVGGRARGVAVNLAGTRAWVGNDDGRIDVIDGITGTVADTIPMEHTSFYGGATNPQGTRAYLTAARFGAEMIVIDTATDAVVTSSVVSFTDEPWGIAIDPTGTRAYISIGDASQIAVVDTTTNLLVDTITLTCNDTCPAPRGITVSPDGKTVYAADFRDGGVVVVDVATASQVDYIDTSSFYTVGVDVTPDGTRLYAVDYDDSSVSVIDTATREVIGTLTGFSGANSFGTFIGGPDGAPPILAADARKCQTAVGAGFAKLAGKYHKLVADCLDDVQRDRAAGVVTPSTVSGCARDLDLDDPSSKAARMRATEIAKLVAKCGDVSATTLGPPCAAAATDLTSLGECVTGRQLESAGRSIAAAYAGACALLAEVDVDVPGVCAP